MGHATQAFLVAYALQRLMGWRAGDAGTTQLQRLAARISINRIVAGTHFPVDAIAGRLLGNTLGEFFVARSGFDPRKCRPRKLLRAELNGWKAAETDFGALEPLKAEKGIPVDTSPILNAMARLARAEWQAKPGSRIPVVELPAEKK